MVREKKYSTEKGEKYEYIFCVKKDNMCISKCKHQSVEGNTEVVLKYYLLFEFQYVQYI